MYPVTHNFDNCTLTEVLFSMSDGIGLYTRLLVPKGGSKCPIVFIRTPYAPASGCDPKLDSDLEAPFVEAGYAVVLQHCRGTGNSEGICIPFEMQ